MTQPITLPQLLFHKGAQGGTKAFVNAAHVVRIELDEADRRVASYSRWLSLRRLGTRILANPRKVSLRAA